MNKPKPPHQLPLWKSIGLDVCQDVGTKTETSILRLKKGYFLRTLSSKRGQVLSESMVWVERESPNELDELEMLIYGRRPD